MRVLLLLVVCIGTYAADELPTTTDLSQGAKTKIEVSELRFRPDDMFKHLVEKIEEYFAYLCKRCEEFIKKIDEEIESEKVKKDAVNLCKMAIKREPWTGMCVTLMTDILEAVYKQLRHFEPKPELCAHLRLCDSCDVNVTRSALNIVARSPEANPAFLISKLSELHSTMTHFATTNVHKDEIIDF
ncbi:unnamed protein product [Cylicocyclus nassatus]|uniref:Saposin B-type domain-containing protein n=1 Tax=Cylicocyclus nassatus TaxID=53992 RepID=A0AA36H8S0_CYLNA|nr:unnamed protein product [Cylicocyclus nassatus]